MEYYYVYLIVPIYKSEEADTLFSHSLRNEERPSETLPLHIEGLESYISRNIDTSTKYLRRLITEKILYAILVVDG